MLDVEVSNIVVRVSTFYRQIFDFVKSFIEKNTSYNLDFLSHTMY